jgi:hypothetical protein
MSSTKNPALVPVRPEPGQTALADSSVPGASAANHAASDGREAARRLRIEAIHFGALARQALGITATYRRLASGAHEVTVAGKSTTAATLAAAIDRAKRGEGR